jgi:MFS family permease
MRALAAALVTMTLNLVGAGFGPLVVGGLSDLFAPHLGVDSIRYALLVAISVAVPTAALSFFRGAPHVRVELERVTVSRDQRD